jgi:hypothetical protein
MQSILLRVGVIGAIIIGAIILRPYLSGNAGNLQVGDCFDLPDGTTDIVDDVQHRPCTDPHYGEVIFVGDYQPGDAGYPSDEAFRSFESEHCTAAFTSYTGIDYFTDTVYDFSTFWPTLEGWQDGDHEISCHLVRVDGAQQTGSLKKQ